MGGRYVSETYNPECGVSQRPPRGLSTTPALGWIFTSPRDGDNSGLHEAYIRFSITTVPTAHAFMAPQRCLRARPIDDHAYGSLEAAACGRRMDGKCVLHPDSITPLLTR